jgi:hypothetical protein
VILGSDGLFLSGAVAAVVGVIVSLALFLRNMYFTNGYVACHRLLYRFISRISAMAVSEMEFKCD